MLRIAKCGIINDTDSAHIMEKTYEIGVDNVVLSTFS